jgi:tripartite-type tricarboxylate transporter receptor subunit TctC
MKLARRQFLRLASATVAIPAVSRGAFAQSYPSRPVRVVVGLAPGGTNDMLARLTAQILSERLGQSFVVENRPGAGGNIATEVVAKAPPDGHTLLFGGVNNAINATLYERLNFNFNRDLVPIAAVFRAPLIMFVNPSLPVKTIPEFIAYAKTNPGKLSMASAGVGTGPHVVGEMFKMMAGVDLVHVPYRGGAPAVTDLLGGQVHVAFFGTAEMLGHIRTGQVKALAVTAATRLDILPDIPTVSEFVPGFEASAWFGVFSRKGTTAEVVDKLNTAIGAGFAEPKIRARLAELGGDGLALSPAEFGRLVADEIEKWARVVRFAAIKLQ